MELGFEFMGAFDTTYSIGASFEAELRSDVVKNILISAS